MGNREENTRIIDDYLKTAFPSFSVNVRSSSLVQTFLIEEPGTPIHEHEAKVEMKILEETDPAEMSNKLIEIDLSDFIRKAGNHPVCWICDEDLLICRDVTLK